jgi:hypothetical protein
MRTLPGPLDPMDARLARLTLLLLAFQMIGAASPLSLFPGEAFTQWPYAPTSKASTSSRTWCSRASVS